MNRRSFLRTHNRLVKKYAHARHGTKRAAERAVKQSMTERLREEMKAKVQQ